MNSNLKSILARKKINKKPDVPLRHESKQFKIDNQKKIIKSFEDEIKELEAKRIKEAQLLESQIKKLETKKEEAQKILNLQKLDGIEVLYVINVTRPGQSMYFETFSKAEDSQNSCVLDTIKEVKEKIAWIKKCEKIFGEWIAMKESRAMTFKLGVEVKTVYEPDEILSLLDDKISKEIKFSEQIMKVVNEAEEEKK